MAASELSTAMTLLGMTAPVAETTNMTATPPAETITKRTQQQSPLSLLTRPNVGIDSNALVGEENDETNGDGKFER
jgi:hypothetical protein